MNRIGLRINGIWCVLPQDVSISIEEQNPLFSDSGSFSYPIEMSVSQNRELFSSIDSPHGRIRPKDLDGLPFELWYDGVMLLYGSVETDDDVDVDDDQCSINLVSGNGDFKTKIEGLQCTDVPLKEDIFLGYVRSDIVFRNKETGEVMSRILLDENHTMSYNSVNVSDPYPLKPFCNVRICTKRTDSYDLETEVPYWVYDADRPWSGTCFYVAYFLDCLFSHLGITVNENHLLDVEDMKRLAFFTTKCEFRYGKEIESLSYLDDYKSYARSSGQYKVVVNVPTENYYLFKEVYATSKNFPQQDVGTLIDGLFSAFGIRIVNDVKNNSLSIYYIRDILRDSEVIDVDMRVLGKSVSYEKICGVKMTYGGDEKDTSFNYSGWDSVKAVSDYTNLFSYIDRNNMNCYVNTRTGNKYRIKVYEEAVEEGDITKLYPSLMEVAQFNDYILGENGDNVEELKIPFVPVIENDVSFSKLSEQGSLKSQRLAVLVDVDFKSESEKKGVATQFVDDEGVVLSKDIGWTKYNDPQVYDESSDNPLRSLDSGFALGVMRGPGSQGGYEVYFENYDGNGNSAWTTVVADYAFTSDTMDAYGNHYDYNGKEPGGVELDGRISLKTHVQTAKDVGLKNDDGTYVDWGIDATAAKRGLADRFMSEYMYWLMHRKTVPMDVDTTLSHLVSLSWFKQLRIDDTVGRLKSRKYTLTNNGVTDMGIEIYTIN